MNRCRCCKGARCRAAAVLLAVLLAAGAPARGTDRVVLDAETTYQTMQGWEATAWASQESEAFPQFRDELFDRVVSEIGINRLRLEIRSGAENSRDYWSEYQRGDIEYQVWRQNRYATVNDNDDPDVLDRSGFHFSELSDTVEKVVVPIKQRLAAAGETLYINLNYVAFTGQIQGGAYEHDDPAEYAEFMLAAFLHLEDHFGWVPDSIEVLLEPDNVSQWDGTLLGRAIVATAEKLSAHGFHPEFIAPSNTNMGNAVKYFDALAAVPGALGHLAELSYHRYGGVSTQNLQAIASRAVQHGLRTSMLEWWSDSNGYAVLHQDLELGRNSAWQEAVVVGFFDVDDADPQHPVLTLKQRTKYTRQYYRFVRRGAVRIGAASTAGRLHPLAFTSKEGGDVVVVMATSGGDFEVEGLSPGLYGVQYTTASAAAVDLPDQEVAGGGVLSATIPARGVATVYAKGPAPQAAFRRGDANSDGSTDVSDAVFLLTYLFLEGMAPDCLKSADANDDGQVDISDAVQVLLSLFVEERPLPPPGGACGADPTADALSCLAYPGCPAEP